MEVKEKKKGIPAVRLLDGWKRKMAAIITDPCMARLKIRDGHEYRGMEVEARFRHRINNIPPILPSSN